MTALRLAVASWVILGAIRSGDVVLAILIAVLAHWVILCIEYKRMFWP